MKALKDLLARLAPYASRLSPYAKYAGFVGYPLFYLVSLVVFASLTFPYETLKDRIITSFDADQHGGPPEELQIASMTGHGLFGVRLTGVTLVSAPPVPGKPPSRLVVDEATLSYGLLSAIFGGTDVDFDVEAFGGEVSGNYGVHGKDKSIDVTLDALDLGKMPPLVDLLGVPVDGKLSGTIRLTMPEGKMTKASGQIALESKGTAVGDGKAKIKDTIALPRIEVGTMTIAADVKDGILKVTKLLAVGRDVDVQGEGRMTLRDSLSDSIADLQIRFRINDAYKTKNDITKSLFGAPGSTVPPLFEMADPKIKMAKRADGYYGWQLRGPLARLDFAPNSR